MMESNVSGFIRDFCSFESGINSSKGKRQNEKKMGGVESVNLIIYLNAKVGDRSLGQPEGCLFNNYSKEV